MPQSSGLLSVFRRSSGAEFDAQLTTKALEQSMAEAGVSVACVHAMYAPLTIGTIGNELVADRVAMSLSSRLLGLASVHLPATESGSRAALQAVLADSEHEESSSEDEADEGGAAGSGKLRSIVHQAPAAAPSQSTVAALQRSLSASGMVGVTLWHAHMHVRFDDTIADHV